MSTLTIATQAAVQTSEPRRTTRAVLALARFETRRLLLSIPVVLAFLVHAAWIVYTTGKSTDDFPALQDADRATQSVPLLVGIAVLLSVNLAVLRSKRHDTERHFAVLVLSPWQRTAAHALSVVPAAVLSALLVYAQIGREAMKAGAVGHASPGELLVGPLTVLLCGMFGVLMGRLIKSAIAAPLLAVFCLFFFVGVSAGVSEGWTKWLTPAVGVASSNTYPSDLLGRPAAAHALYLTGLALFLALAAVLVSGGRTRTATATITGALAGALALTLTGAVAQSAGDSKELIAARELASVNPAKVQKCATHGGSTYCAFPEWMSRTPTWAATVDSVQSLAGGSASGQKLLIRQRIDARYGLDSDSALEPSSTPNEVTVGTSWDGNRVPEFSAAVAAVLVTGSEKAGGDLECDGRMVTIMWLGMAGRPDPLTSLSNVRLDDSLSGSAIVLSQTNPLSMTAGQTDVVVELLKQPRDTVAAKVKQNWAELTSAKVKTSRAAELLGVAVPEGADKCEG